jgi:hypothetical protein
MPDKNYSTDVLIPSMFLIGGRFEVLKAMQQQSLLKKEK